MLDKDVRPVIARRVRCLGIGILLLIPSCGLRAAAQSKSGVTDSPVVVSGQICQEWEDDGEQVAVIRRNCLVGNNSVRVRGRQVVVWRRPRTDGGEDVTVYGEELQVQRSDSTRTEPATILYFHTSVGVRRNVETSLKKPARHEEFFKRAMRHRRNTQPEHGGDAEGIRPATTSAGLMEAWQPVVPQNARRVRIRPRTSRPFNIRSHRSENAIPAEQIIEVTGGVSVVIDGFASEAGGQQIPLGVIDLAADRMVIWTDPSEGLQTGEFVQAGETPFQVYLEGNIEIRQGGNVLTATHGFFDVRNDRALLLNGELRAYLPNVDGQIRVRAERIRQSARTRFHAQNAWVTTSPHGKPGYRLEASDIFVESRPTPAWLRSRRDGPSPYGLPPNESLWVTSVNNRLVIGDTPVAAFPRVSGPAEDPGIPIRRASVSYDNIFGVQVKTVWDVSRLLGSDKPEGLEWNLLADYYSDRGPGIGTGTRYQGQNPGHAWRGDGMLYYIRDGGRDTLGRDRMRLTPESKNRGRAQWRHRSQLPHGVTIFGELGWLSDRNLLEQYYEQEFDEGKDVETLIRAKQDRANWSGSLLIRPQLNDFETTTEWLPKLDVCGFSEPLFGGRLTWSSHSSLGYGRLRPADAPADPSDLFMPLPYVAAAEGLVAMTRHEIDAPFSLGPVKVTPFAMGELAHWDEGYTNSSVDRAVFSGGLRANVLFTKSLPQLRNRFFNLSGLTHKVEYALEYRYTDSSENLSNIPLYNEIDDNAQERFRTRFLMNTFGGTLPPQFDPRSFALRNGAGFQVSAPYHELVDDQQILRLTTRQRLQTRTGPSTNPRIRDWMSLETGFAYFPRKNQNNFNDEFGVYFARYQWHLGERTSVVANGLWDTFRGGQRQWNVGVLSQRSRRGSVYVGYRSVHGGAPLQSDIVTASFSYAMSPKWVATAGTAYDLGMDQDRGQSLTLSRIGLDWIVHVGANVDRSKNNVGFAFMVEPRFGSLSSSPVQLNSLLGVR